MQPNVFIYYPDCPEDYFSRSLAYILNLMPNIGKKFTQRIAVVAGKKSDYFGEFLNCEFVGQEFQDGHRLSKPDLKIRCSRRTIFVENKLESPLNFEQMQKHSILVTKEPNCKLLFISNILHNNNRLRILPGYLHPKNVDHYLWLDFLPVFSGDHSRNRLVDKILSDFIVAMKINKMIGRTIKGASGSLYTYNSEASHLALNQLWDLFKEIGFKVSKKPAHETTIRAYPIKHRQYPLLNPRFEPTASWMDPDWDRECLNITVLSKGNYTSLDRQLRKFETTKDCTFIARPFETRDGYYYHGHFLLATAFIGNPSKIDFVGLKQPLTKIFDFLKENVSK